MELIRPEWPAAARVHALVTTRNTREDDLRAVLPGEPRWLRQVHGARVASLDEPFPIDEADAAVTRLPNTVCAIRVADCMPVFFVDEGASTIAAAHAGWRGLAAGVLEAALRAMTVAPRSVLAWMGPAIGPRVYEVGDEVRAAFLEQDGAAASAFVATRPGHWLADLYALARQRLARAGVERVFGGGFCTYSEPERFYSYRRSRDRGRMAALIWLTGVESGGP